MKTKDESTGFSVVALLFAIVSAIAGGNSLAALAPQLNGWAAAGYAIVAALFIAAATVILLQIISSLRDA